MSAGIPREYFVKFIAQPAIFSAWQGVFLLVFRGLFGRGLWPGAALPEDQYVQERRNLQVNESILYQIENVTPFIIVVLRCIYCRGLRPSHLLLMQFLPTKRISRGPRRDSSWIFVKRNFCSLQLKCTLFWNGSVLFKLYLVEPRECLCK